MSSFERGCDPGTTTAACPAPSGTSVITVGCTCTRDRCNGPGMEQAVNDRKGLTINNLGSGVRFEN